MEVVYKKSITEKILDKIEEARKVNREINYISLTGKEWEALSKENGFIWPIVGVAVDSKGYYKTQKVYGIEVRLYDRVENRPDYYTIEIGYGCR
jgi:hypothetical protein